MDRRLDVAYRHQKNDGKPLFVSNDVTQRLALEVRRQIGCGKSRRVTAKHLLSIQEIQANGIRFEVSWCIDGPVTNEDGVPVLGLCEYDAEGLPNTALIFANPEACEGNDKLLISTLAHELGHGVFDAPAWIVASRMETLPGLFGPAGRRMFRTVTPDEEHLTSGDKRAEGKPDFAEWRANEFMGSLLVPRDKLVATLHDLAATLQVPIEYRCQSADLVAAEPQASIHVARDLSARDRMLRIPAMINALADAFGVSRRFIQVRLLRYGLIEEEQLNAM